MPLKAAIFDMDGVITDTAQFHVEAWEIMFNAFFERYDKMQLPFTYEDYFYYVDGKLCIDGIKSFLLSRGLELPSGDSEDTQDTNTLYEFSNWKNNIFADLFNQKEIKVFLSTIKLI